MFSFFPLLESMTSLSFFGCNNIIVQQILRRLRRKLKSGAYCAFVTKDESLELVIESLGYKIIDSAHVPQKNFVLPSSKKGQKNKPDKGNSSNCVVTLAQIQ